MDSDNAWWAFSLDSSIRNDRVRGRLTAGADGAPPMDYHTYLHLAAILGAQTPTSFVPDERVFITTHQLFEVVFKQTTFDLAVIAETLRALVRADGAEFIRLALARGEAELDFWRPALTAAHRVKLSSEGVLPLLMQYLGGADGEETFSGVEFFYFRENLAPASGFQSAQFRLIQRAFGKSEVLSLRLFPSGAHGERPGGGAAPTLRVTDERLLVKGARVATPPDGSPLARVARLEDEVNAVLSRLSLALGPVGGGEPFPFIEEAQVEKALKAFASILSPHRVRGGASAAHAEGAVAALRADLYAAARRENARRASLAEARRGACRLRDGARCGYLSRVLDALVAADEALFGAHDGSFLSVHYEVAKRRIAEVSAHAAAKGEAVPAGGTGGGGIEYLGLMRKHLIPLFPALICCRDPKCDAHAAEEFVLAAAVKS